MTQYAYFNSSASGPQPVLGWYDTVAISYPTLPTDSDLLPVTTQQWVARMSQLWVVNNGTLEAYVPPAPTLAQQAASLMLGTIAITSTGTPALDGSYAIDAATQAHLMAEMQSIQVTGKFADGTTSVAWPDATGAVHTFPSVVEFQAFALAIGGFVAACYKVINGVLTTIPAASAT
ncbi:MAG: hypothetical protein B7X10_06400, partial [Burkholderiales bacterium 21-58-4]